MSAPTATITPFTSEPIVKSDTRENRVVLYLEAGLFYRDVNRFEGREATMQTRAAEVMVVCATEYARALRDALTTALDGETKGAA